MNKYKVPIQSLIDHIKTACDVDPWAKEMAEELLKEKEPVYALWREGKAYCGHCGARIPPKIGAKFCHRCGVQFRIRAAED